MLRRRSTNRRFETLGVDLAELRAAARPHGYSVHDAYVAAVCGGLRIYHEKLGIPIDVLPLGMPIALATGDRSAGGDLWSGLRMAAPIGEADPVKRMRIVRDTVLTTRAEPAFLSLRTVAPLIAWLPTQMLTGFGQGDGAADVYVSSAAGQAAPVYVSGVRVDRIIPISPLLGGAMVIVMYSLAGRCQLGINLDVASVKDPELFLQCLQLGLDEVTGSASPERKTSRSTTKRRTASAATVRSSGSVA